LKELPPLENPDESEFPVVEEVPKMELLDRVAVSLALNAPRPNEAPA
jgi:hypothetical protein